ncbi:MAG: hypothetical protein ACREB3_07230 [Burkholderiales bacterium]
MSRARAAWRTLELGRSTGRHLRKYRRRWFRLRSENRQFRLKRASRAREKYKDPARRAAALEACRRWRRRNAARHRRQVRRYYHTHLRKFCFNCKRAGRCGRGALKMIQRNVNVGGRLVERDVLWCGRC